MRTRWQLLTDDVDERRTFADLARTLALPAVAAGPKNRHRQVTRLDTAHGVYFLKRFDRTQWKNRLRFACTAPRASNDAEREWRVTDALHAAGFAAPRAVAVGHHDGRSYYLCALLPGRDLRTLLLQGAVDDGLRRQVAARLGAMLLAGFHLPDLSADHVFVDERAVGERQLAVLDLHNGRCVRAGRPPLPLLRRVLRHFARSVQDLGLPWPPVLRFTLRLLRAAGHEPARARRMLQTMPPWSTAQRYETAGKSLAYAERNARRTARELQLLREVWPGRRDELVLDLPCGAGRLSPLLRELGHRVVAADGALTMLVEARNRHPDHQSGVQADARVMPFADGAVDGVVVFRFLHHLPDDAARLVVAEACRTARRFVVVSFFHPCSAHHLQRGLRAWAGRSPTRFARTLAKVRGWFGSHGYELHQSAAELPYVRDLWLASFVRR